MTRVLLGVLLGLVAVAAGWALVVGVALVLIAEPVLLALPLAIHPAPNRRHRL